MKWTAFDQETAAALARHVEGVELSQTASDELDAALDAATAAPAAVLTPASDREHTLLITMRTKESDSGREASESATPSSYQAGGFLGLADEPVFTDDKKKR
jgi:hypothetical protein